MIEAAHAGIRNELACGVLPCARFGANAAWFRFAGLSFHVLTALKRLAARPGRLRFLIFHTPGKLVRHARRKVLRLLRTLPLCRLPPAATDGFRARALGPVGRSR